MPDTLQQTERQIAKASCGRGGPYVPRRSTRWKVARRSEPNVLHTPIVTGKIIKTVQPIEMIDGQISDGGRLGEAQIDGRSVPPVAARRGCDVMREAAAIRAEVKVDRAAITTAIRSGLAVLVDVVSSTGVSANGANHFDSNYSLRTSRASGSSP